MIGTNSAASNWGGEKGLDSELSGIFMRRFLKVRSRILIRLTATKFFVRNATKIGARFVFFLFKY
jgi:hypothetical protein